MRKFGDKARVALLLASVAASPFALAAPAFAQDGVTEDEEIVVTARRTEESLQDVPGSVSAFSESRLEQLQATDATGLQGAIPNVNIVQGRGSSNATNITIRGVGQPDALQTFDPAVGFYVDDVYYSRIRGTQLEVFDIERVEVLRGPQGTLYGRNTIGGAFKVVTRRPGQDPHGLFQVTVGDYGQLETRIAASGPITNNLAIGGALFGAGRDGYVTNPINGDEYNNRNAFGGRVALAWDPTSTFSIDWSADIADEDNALVMGQATTTLFNLGGAAIYPISSPPPEYDFTASATPGLPNSTQLTHWGTTLRASWEINPALTLRSITAYRNLKYDDYVDIDATPVELGDVFVGVRQHQISQDLQLVYDQGAWNVVGGLYYMRANVDSHQEAYADAYVNGVLGLTSFTRTIDDELQTTSMAAFVNATYAVTDRFNISAGLRSTNEEKEYFRTTSTFYSNPLFNGTFAFDVDNSCDDLSPMLSADYQVTDNVMVYARGARGFLSGGFNGRANNPGEEAPYEPESFDLVRDWHAYRLA
ncbi:MAG: TonB-dependent receptor [Caulobacteraceae bacterium]|nr:TonB-dependent receptor [Caulobacteraceae bacterium]